ncbi:hypothetical protein AB5I41_17890 [Sphingomonas sp. MMS24-JH45]
MPRLFEDAISLVADNRIFKQRNVDIATVSRDDAIAWGFSGPMIRAAGIPWDLRKSQPYDVSTAHGVRHPRGHARRLLRPLHGARGGGPPVGADHAPVPERDARRPDRDARPQGRAARAGRDEALDGSADPPFQALYRGLSRPRGRSVCRDREPKGEFGVYLVSDGSNKPYRCKIRPTAFSRLQAMDFMSRSMLADTTAILGAMDIVFGECDR